MKLRHFDTLRVFPMLITSLLLGACSTNPFASGSEGSILRDKSLDYAQSKVVARLTVPVGLDASSIQQDLLSVPIHNDVQAVGVLVAPRPDFVFAQAGSASARLLGDGQQKRISVVGNVTKVKQQVIQFWTNQKILMVPQQIGTQEVVETEWFSLSDETVSDDFISRWIRGLTDADDIAHGRVRIELLPKTAGRVELILSFLQQSQLQISQQTEMDWGAAGQTLENESELTFELLRYLSRTAQVAQKTQQTQGQQDLVLLGQDQFGEPVIQLDMSVEKSQEKVLQAMSDFDVGSHDIKAQKIYFTYSSHQAAESQKQSSSAGILGWFKGLHSSGERKQGVNINLALLGGGDEVVNLPAAPVYSSNPELAEEVKNLEDKKGYKIWLAGEVIYVFEDENQGTLNNQGEYTYVGQYQLNFEATLKNTYVQVLNSQGQAAPTVYAKEILWKIQQRLDALK